MENKVMLLKKYGCWNGDKRMREEPVYCYVCEYCGKSFKHRDECASHERYCKHESTCPDCRGEGKFTLDFGGLINGYGRYRECICETCRGKGRIYKC